MKTLKGPSLHLAQFSDDAAPFNSLPAIAQWAAQTGFKALQIPAWDSRLFDLATAAESQTYCDELVGMLADHGAGGQRTHYPYFWPVDGGTSGL